MSLSLYAINDEYTAAVQLALEYASENDGVLPEFWEAELDKLAGTMDEKRISCAHVYKNFCAEAEAIKAEEKKLAARRKTAEAAAERIKAYITAYTPAGMKIEAPTVSIGWRKSSECIVDNVNQLPAEYKEQITEWKIDKMGIKAAAKGGTVIPGARIENHQNIQIK